MYSSGDMENLLEPPIIIFEGCNKHNLQIKTLKIVLPEYPELCIERKLELHLQTW